MSADFASCPNCQYRCLPDATSCPRCFTDLRMLPCPHCGHRNSRSAVLCVECITDLRSQKCRHCGEMNMEEAETCGSCRKPLRGGNVPSVARMDPVSRRVVQAGLLLFVISFALSHLSIFLSPTPDAWMLFLYAVLGGLLFPIMLIGVLWLTLAGRSFQDIHFLLAPISGATLGIAATMVLDLVVPLVGMAFGARLALPIAVGAAEELAKMLAIWWLLKQERYNQGVHGLVAGILVGLGFAAVEDVFYTVSSLSAVHGKTVLFVILIRMMTSLAHPAWSACLAVELWREKRVTVQFTGPVVRMYLMVALLHALWDYSLLTPIFEYEKGGGPTIISAVCTLSLFLVQAKRANIPVNA